MRVERAEQDVLGGVPGCNGAEPVGLVGGKDEELGFRRGWLRCDVIAGATVWGLLVPESIAYAGLAGLPPQAGLYTLLVTLAAYAVFGTSRHLVAAATSAAAVLLASSVGGLAGADAARYMSDAAGLVIELQSGHVQ